MAVRAHGQTTKKAALLGEDARQEEIELTPYGPRSSQESFVGTYRVAQGPGARGRALGPQRSLSIGARLQSLSETSLASQWQQC